LSLCNVDWTDKADSSSSAIIEFYHLTDLVVSHGETAAATRLLTAEKEEVSTAEKINGRGAGMS
jgi:hypothetical protein